MTRKPQGKTKLKIFIAGAGRMGGALARAWGRAGHRVRVRDPRLPATRRLVHGAPFEMQEADVIFLCVPDSAVQPAAEWLAAQGRGEALRRRRQVVAHCAGALDLSVLEPAARLGARPGSLHPLWSVPSSNKNFDGAHAAVDGDAAVRRILANLARDAGMKPFRLARGDRALYHAAAVLAANGLVGLAGEAAQLLERCGLEREEALEALMPLMRSALDSVERQGLPGALTGPIARGDSAVVEANLRALERVSENSSLLYRMIGFALLRIAAEQGQVPRAKLATLASLIKARQGRGRARAR
jgi:predicted short-subunit dehydrogenase-like oxidoreductase (DUF2520 family)